MYTIYPYAYDIKIIALTEGNYDLGELKGKANSHSQELWAGRWREKQEVTQVCFVYPQEIFLILKKLKSKFCEKAGILCTVYKNWIRFQAPFNINRPKKQKEPHCMWGEVGAGEFVYLEVISSLSERIQFSKVDTVYRFVAIICPAVKITVQKIK